ncbi:hypothetical protein [Peribacillus loiseleuriae]|uniref:hypothetical protein n=1 Tax=Peribacillus loiseleuriae TaxID=1679170 RepID=UPI0015D5BD75|nr:hypothetical protein [Peribacillus loiseleuriae]
MKDNSLIVIIDFKDVRRIKKEFDTAKKELGIVDMADPHYKVEIGKDAFFLWISDESGTIMNLKDTHTIYTLSENAADLMNELIKK